MATQHKPPRPLADVADDLNTIDARPMPHSERAERAVLGSILIDPDALYAAVDILNGPDDFYLPLHRQVYSAALALARDGLDIDALSIAEYIAENKSRDDADVLASEVDALANAVPTSAHVATYAQIVRKRAVKRYDVGRMGVLAAMAIDPAISEQEYDDKKRGIIDAMQQDTDGATADALEVLSLDDVIAQPPAVGIMGDVLYEGTTAFLYGPSGRWKTFIALDMALSIASGDEWMGKATVQGDVVYVAGEGARGIGVRAQAWKMARGMGDMTLPMYVIPSAVNLASGRHVAMLARRLTALDITPRLIVFDTLATCNAGDEKESENASAIDRHCRSLIQAFPGACVLMVHHTGYDTTHMRGSTALYAGADTVIRIEGGKENRRLELGEGVNLICDKPRGSEPFSTIALTAAMQTWADDESGETRASLVMVPASAEASQAARQAALSRQERAIEEKKRAMLDILADAGESGMSANDWMRACGVASTTFHRFRASLFSEKRIDRTATGDYICLTAPNHSQPLPR